MVEPMYSPWGTVDHCKMLCYGAFEVQTARHGGVKLTDKKQTKIQNVNTRCGIAYGCVQTIKVKADILVVQGGTYDAV